MSKPTIAIDFDDVLFPFIPTLTDYVNEKLNLEVSIDDYGSFDFSEVWDQSVEATIAIVQNYLIEHPDEATPIKGSFGVLNSWREKFDFIIVTSRENDIRPQTEAWLETNFPNIFKEVFMVGHHYNGKTPKPKGLVCAEQQALMLIDDHPNHIVSAQEHGLEGLLFGGYPWQARVTDINQRHFIQNWAQLDSKLHKAFTKPATTSTQPKD